MAKRGPHSFAKRQREIEKKRKAEEKRERRFRNKQAKAAGEETPPTTETATGEEAADRDSEQGE